MVRNEDEQSFGRRGGTSTEPLLRGALASGGPSSDVSAERQKRQYQGRLETQACCQLEEVAYALRTIEPPKPAGF